MNKIILIERYSNTSRFWPNMERDNNLKLTVEHILYNYYKGFEGELISYFEVPKNTNILNFAKALIEIPYDPDKQNHLTLYVCSDLNNSHSYMNEVALNVGYDVGWCEDVGSFYEDTFYSFSYSSYSSIFHEVLFGKVQKLVAYKDYLNEYLLFSDKSLAQQYANLHTELEAQGEDVERETMKIYEIWKLNR
jgi:hypothetical protein